MTEEGKTPLPLQGLRVIDCASLFAGPVIATLSTGMTARQRSTEVSSPG